MHSQRGNFLLQALLALTLVFAFVPFFARRLAVRDISAQMYATTQQIETAKTAAKIFVRENADSLPYDTTTISGDKFSDILEPYGLPLGFVAKTALGQNISLIITKNSEEVTAILRLDGGGLNRIQRAELARRIGFYATYDVEGDSDNIDIGIQLTDMYSDVVRRNDSHSDVSGFLADLDMNKFKFDNAGTILAHRGAFDTAEIGTLTVTGIEAGRKERNNILAIKTDKTVFQNKSGEAALSVTRGTLNAGSVFAKTVSKFGDTGNMSFTDASIDSFEMSAGRTSFTGPHKWDVHGNIVTTRISFTIERLDVNSFINITRGQDVFIDEDTLAYSSSSGIDTDYIYSSNITLRDQTSEGLARGNEGVAILDIRPAGTSLLPDALVDTINNNSFSILVDPTDNSGDVIGCNSIISGLGNSYNQKSLAQYIICQYVFWQRLEHRIDIKQCLQGGGSDCR